MRFLSFLLVAAAATIDTVSCLKFTTCYPSPCGTYTAPTPDASNNQQLTTWVKNIALEKFDNQDHFRTLNKVTIKTIFKFTTSSYVNCTNTVDYCANTYSGSGSPGVEFKMDLASDPDILPQYWGRWGDYPYVASGGSYASPGTPPANNKNLAIDYTTGESSTIPMFAEYTYPLFDIIGFQPERANPENFDPESGFGLCDIGTCTAWGYYLPTSSKGVSFWYGDSATGKIVSYDPNLKGNAGGYTQAERSKPLTPKYTWGQGSSTATPQYTEVFLGTEEYNIVTPTPTPIVKSISDTDPNGGINQDILPSTVLALFQDTVPGSPLLFTANATGVIAYTDIGGNAIRRQETYAFVQMAIEYEYTADAASATQDPQFVGFQGQSFQVHGYPGSYFHLISAPSFQMNGRFTYLANGHCNYKHTPCWTHPGTYIDDVTLIVDELLVRITAGPVGSGYSVRINDEPFHAHAHGANETDHTDVREFVPTKFYDAATRLTVHLRSPLQISIRTDLFAFTLHNADHFFNVDSQLLVRPILAAGRQVSSRYPHPVNGQPWFPEYPIHGFIGQTWANATYAHHKLYQGDVDDYVETRPYSTESTYSQYSKKFDENDMHWE